MRHLLEKDTNHYFQTVHLYSMEPTMIHEIFLEFPLSLRGQKD
jgi:hypothetical protein